MVDSTIERILNECEIRYNGEIISKEIVLRDFAANMEKLSSSQGHKVGVMLHTGSVAFSVVAAVTAAVLCITEDFKSTEEIVQALSIGDIVFFDKKRAEFIGTKKWKDIEYYGFRTDDKTNCVNYIPCNMIATKKITPYAGASKKLGGIGVKKKSFFARMEFIKYLWNAGNDELSTLITKSFAFVIDKETANSIYENTIIAFFGKNFYLKELVTASYYTEDREYIWGSNPGKENPVLMFFSKIDDARQRLIEDSSGECRIIGIIVVGNEYLRGGNGIETLLDRQSTKSAYFSGKLDYSKTYEDFAGEIAEYWTLIPNKIDKYALKTDKRAGKIINELRTGVAALAAPSMKKIVLYGAVDTEKYRKIRRSLMALRVNGDNADFIMRAFSLLNLFLGAIFPLEALNKVDEKSKISRVESVPSKFAELAKSAVALFGDDKTEAQMIVMLLNEMYAELIKNNPKGDYLLELIKNGRMPDVLIVPKAYFASIFIEWVSGQINTSEKSALSKLAIKTVGEIKFSDKTFASVIYTCSNFGETNPHTLFVAENRSLLIYECEIGRASRQEKAFLKCKYNMLVRFGEEAEGLESEATSALTEEENEELLLDSAVNDIMLENVRRYANHRAEGYDSTMQSEVSRIVEFSGGEFAAYFTKRAYVYCLRDGGIEDIEAEKIVEGDTLLFSNVNEGRDLFGVIITKLFEVSEEARNRYAENYRLSREWRSKLKLYLRENTDAEAFVKNLSIREINRDFMTIRQWADEDSHIIGPRSSEAPAVFKAIGEILADSEMIDNAQNIADACGSIRSLRGRVLEAIKKAVVNKHTCGEIDALLVPVADKIEKLSLLLQVERILDHKGKMPSHLTNKPIAIYNNTEAL